MAIEINTQINNKGKWVKIVLDNDLDKDCFATIQTPQFKILRKLSIFSGTNLIDVMQIQNNTIQIKVETPFETILKEINL